MLKTYQKAFLLLGGAVLIIASCWDAGGKSYKDERSREGAALSQQFCANCHLHPEPDWLDKATWANFVLPKMGELLGHRYMGMNSYVQVNTGSPLTEEQWGKIVYHYITEAPSQPLPRTDSAGGITIGLKHFQVSIPGFATAHPVTTMVKIDTSSRSIFIGDGLAQQLYWLDPITSKVDSFPVETGIAQMSRRSGSLSVLTMGVLLPSDARMGKLVVLNEKSGESSLLLDSLKRPVHMTYADLNADNLEDILVCEFGNQTGQLGWYEQSGKGKFLYRSLRQLPGAIRTAVQDFNKDGKPDIMALMAQGDEGVFIYYNKGNGAFREERVLQFPPVYGSNYFELADMNKDGFLDIIATNGDNGDYPPILKAYHGIRIYLNNGQNKFKEEVFLPMHGVGKAMALDYDLDGDLDLASISFFPDRDNTPEEGFVYWENKGGLKFSPNSFAGAESGNWITMDAGDLDGDGDWDIVLGNADFGMGNAKVLPTGTGFAVAPSVLLLRNTIR